MLLAYNIFRIVVWPRKAQSILEELAKHEPLTSIAIESNKSKSAISQVIKRIENQIGSKRHFLQLFFKQF